MKRAYTYMLVFLMAFSIVNLTPKEKVNACTYYSYPAVSCISKSNLPSTYQLMYQVPDRRLGAWTGGVTVGALGFLPLKVAGVASWGFAAGYSFYDTFVGNQSYRVYMMKSPVSSKKMRVMVVYYKNTNYSGAMTIRITDK
ncbi:hypothetical protein [Alkalihalobacterium elongatum]|uniref:hypothetical protein n=1 Tax=Alkalihalobacterium elongatum TaxID=2675466 RepID=UPI001C1FADB7|nr:hypothetical protein [Alkalihalobacterium elongatum]